MKIVILADSQGLPRAKGWGNIPYVTTYPHLLDKKLRDLLGKAAPYVIDGSLRGRTMRHVLARWEEDVELKSADLVILQVGGSDCIPRIFLPKEQEWIARFPVKRLRQRLQRLEKRYRRQILNWLPQRVCVPFDEFEKGVKTVVERCANRILILVNITYPTDHILENLPGVNRNIRNYNRVFERFANCPGVKLVDLKGELLARGNLEKLTVDGIHLNRAGHEVLAALLFNVIQEIRNGLESAPDSNLKKFREAIA